MTVALTLHRAKSSIFSEELFSSTLWSEIVPLAREHWNEVGLFKDIPLAPNCVAFEHMQRSGIMRLYTARNEMTGELDGYAAFIIAPNIHYSTSLQASQDVIYIRPEARGFTGIRFIKWCDEQLASLGVQVINQHTKLDKNFGRLLERQGYKPTNVVYSKKLY